MDMDANEKGHDSDANQHCEDGVQQQYKKEYMWMDCMVNSISRLFSIIRTAEAKPSKDNDWEVPYESLTDLVYLNSGAQGVVYWGNLHGELVAIKKLRSKHETNIKHLRKLSHENIVRFRGVCTQPPNYCVIMEYCQYGPLSEFLHSGTCVVPKQIHKWAKEISRGMAYLHNHKIIHRDLKSPNILIADNLVVKVSDFDTSREWNDVSTLMTFTGTVAWMAPEVIRHEPCSERVDVWSFGVVLWELLTQEVPYKNLETNSILWGVGNETISLPILANCPESMKVLLYQCWNKTPRNRPPFKIITAMLEIIGEEWKNMRIDSFTEIQTAWRKETHEAMERRYVIKQAQHENNRHLRNEEHKHARDILHIYEKQLSRTNELFMEVCAVKLQLEQREKELSEREEALKTCRCNFRRNFKKKLMSSSSSDLSRLRPVHSPSAHRQKKLPAVLRVDILDAKPNETVTVTVKDDDMYQCIQNNNIPFHSSNDTPPALESNGNFNNNDTDVKCQQNKINDNVLNVPDVAQV